MTTTIYLVRHGESQANVERVFSNGKVDLPLTRRGQRQAELAAAYLAGLSAAGPPVAHLFSAPLLRARQTAAVIAPQLGLDPAAVTVLADLDEVRVGDLDGRRDETSWQLHDQVVARWREGDREARFPGGESFGDAYDRYERALQEIARRFPQQAVVAVTHGAIQLTVLPRLCPALGERFRSGEVRWSLGNTAVSTLEVSAEGVTCPSWGYADHMVAVE